MKRFWYVLIKMDITKCLKYVEVRFVTSYKSKPKNVTYLLMILLHRLLISF